MFDLKNKKGIIFGATGYIGQKLSYELSKMGCKLILHGNSIKRLNELDDKIKKIKILELGQEIYTPSDTDSKDFENFDYPFGGWTFLKYALQTEKKNNRVLEYGFQIGLTGKWSLADKIQNIYHKKIINADIPTWEAQIPNAAHFNIFISYYLQSLILPKIFFYRKFYHKAIVLPLIRR